MAWIYAPVVESGAQSGESSAGEQSATSRMTPTASNFCKPGCATELSATRRFGTICGASTGDRGVDEWISSLAASPASPIPSQDNNEGKPTSVIYGPIQGESFAKWNPDSYSLRTYQACLLRGWEEYSESLPPTGMMRNGQLYRLQTLVRRTSEKGSGSWPTPRASIGLAMRLTEYGLSQNENRCGNLEDVVLQRMGQAAIGGIVNPQWIAWLMGWPLMWTAPEPLVTDGFPRWQQSLWRAARSFWEER